MTVYLGSLGRMVPIYSTPSAQLETEERYSFSTTLEGRRKAQARPIGRRTWGLNAQFADPSESAMLQQFANGAWGPGPFVFVSADAPVTNLLSPAAAACLDMEAKDQISAGGPVNLGADGWEGQSIVSSDPYDAGIEMYFGIDFVPVLQGVPVTVSAFIQGDQSRVRIYWYGADPVEGSPVIGVTASEGSSTADGMQRVSVTELPPSGAVACRVVGYRASRGTRPSVTWTNEAFPWAAGEGCPKAVIHQASKTLVMASRDPRGGRYASLSYTITEVG